MIDDHRTLVCRDGLHATRCKRIIHVISAASRGHGHNSAQSNTWGELWTAGLRFCRLFAEITSQKCFGLNITRLPLGNKLQSELLSYSTYNSLVSIPGSYSYSNCVSLRKGKEVNWNEDERMGQAATKLGFYSSTNKDRLMFLIECSDRVTKRVFYFLIYILIA